MLIVLARNGMLDVLKHHKQHKMTDISFMVGYFLRDQLGAEGMTGRKPEILKSMKCLDINQFCSQVTGFCGHSKVYSESIEHREFLE